LLNLEFGLELVTVKRLGVQGGSVGTIKLPPYRYFEKYFAYIAYTLPFSIFPNGRTGSVTARVRVFHSLNSRTGSASKVFVKTSRVGSVTRSG